MPALTAPSTTRPFARGFALAFLAAALGACSDLKIADDDDPAPAAPSTSEAGAAGTGVSDAGEASDAGAAGAASDGGAPAALRGPGPHGSLPSGYCCTADTECRYRHCVDTGSGGSKMCVDECPHDTFCTRPDLKLTCGAATGAGGTGPRLCQAPPGFACLPAAQFERGASPIGACCNATSPATADGTSASHCEGNQCAAVGSSPLVCTHRCEFAKDCPGGFVCTMFGTSKACVPTSSSYTCE